MSRSVKNGAKTWRQTCNCFSEDVSELGLRVNLLRIGAPLGKIAGNRALVGLNVGSMETVLEVLRLRRRIRLSLTAIRTSQVENLESPLN